MSFKVLYLANTKILYRLNLNLKVLNHFEYSLIAKTACVYQVALLTKDLKCTDLSRFGLFYSLLHLKGSKTDGTVI